jgi:hypothetical protein
MTVDALLWAPRMAYYLGPEHKGLPIEPFLSAVLIRDAAVLFLVALVLRDIYRPTFDPVRAAGTIDPNADTFPGAPGRRAGAAPTYLDMSHGLASPSHDPRGKP